MKPSHPLALALAATFALSQAASGADPAHLEFFETQVRPLLVEHCYKCHSEDAARAGKLKRRAAARHS